jgi:hypothetical protein
MYFSSDDKGEFSAMVWNWPGEEVRCFYPVYMFLLMTLPEGCLGWTACAVNLGQFMRWKFYSDTSWIWRLSWEPDGVGL